MEQSNKVELLEAKQMNDFPLYPPLTDEGQKEAQALLEDFKGKLKAAAEEVVSKLYTDVIPYIETDSWTNFRNELLDGMKNYENRKIQAQHDFKQIRLAILSEHRDAIVADLNQDLLEEVKTLKEQIADMRKRSNHGTY